MQGFLLDGWGRGSSPETDLGGFCREFVMLAKIRRIEVNKSAKWGQQWQDNQVGSCGSRPKAEVQTREGASEEKRSTRLGK